MSLTLLPTFKRTGVHGTAEEVSEIRGILDTPRTGAPVIGVSGKFIKADCRLDALRRCTEIAHSRGLPNDGYFYGMSEDGELLSGVAKIEGAESYEI